MKVFFARVFTLAKDLLTLVRNTNNRVTSTPEEKKRHDETTVCDLCKVPFCERSDYQFKDSPTSASWEEIELMLQEQVRERMSKYINSYKLW